MTPPAPVVIVADHDQDTRNIYSVVLRYLGAEVLEAADADTAVALARTHAVTAAITEILWLADGECLPFLLRRLPETAHLAVYVVTASVQPDVHANALSAGCAAVLLKPCAPFEIASRVLGLDPRSARPG